MTPGVHPEEYVCCMKPNLFSMSKLFFLAGVLLLASCSKERITGSGDNTAEERNTGTFTRVSLATGVRVHISKAPNFQVLVQGYRNLLPYIQTKVSGNTLEISSSANTSLTNNNVEVYITLPQIEEVRNSSSANIDIKGEFDADLFNAYVSGSGNIDAQGRNISIIGADLSGSGSIRAFGVPAAEADVHLSGSGSVEVTAYVRLTAHVSGSGNVYYKGGPVVQSYLTGSGFVIRRD